MQAHSSGRRAGSRRGGGPDSAGWIGRRVEWLRALRQHEALPGKYTVMLVALLVDLVVTPFWREQGSPITLAVVFTAIGLSGFYLVLTEDVGRHGVITGRRRRIMVSVAFVLAISSILGRGFIRFHSQRWIIIAVTSTWTLFLGLVTLSMLRFVMKTRRVNSDTISASICVYLLSTFAWACLFALVDELVPHSFSFPTNIVVPASGEVRNHFMIESFIYYSMVTMATIGYGDMLPTSPPARALSALEGISGQLYLAILVARLVGMHIASDGSNDSSKR